MSTTELAQVGLEPRLPSRGLWRIDPAHTSIEVVARHLMITKVRSRFSEFDGTFEMGDGPEDTKIRLSIRAASIDTRNEQRDAHLRSPDFLDVETFPTIDFESKSIERKGQGYDVAGDLTIRGITRPVVIESAYVGLATDPYGNEKAVFSGRTEVDREDYGISWNVALEAGGVLVGPKLTIELEVQAVKE